MQHRSTNINNEISRRFVNIRSIYLRICLRITSFCMRHIPDWCSQTESIQNLIEKWKFKIIASKRELELRGIIIIIVKRNRQNLKYYLCDRFNFLSGMCAAIFLSFVFRKIINYSILLIYSLLSFVVFLRGDYNALRAFKMTRDILARIQ